MAFAAAAERLVTDGLDATFSVVGPDGGDLRTLRRFIAERPALAGRLRYEGALPHDRAVDRLRRADLYVLPSVEDQAAPMSLLEAMAAGVASICTTECGLAGTLAREGAALVANPTDDAIYGAMRRLLVDRAARARISAAAAVTVASRFSMAPVAEALEEEYGTPEPNGTYLSRQHLLWVTDDATLAHVEVWDALRAGTDLTVALLDDGSGTYSQSLQPQLTGRGYAVVRVAVRGDHAARTLRDMIRDRPDVVILDSRRSNPHRTLARWALWSGVRVVTAAAGAGPGAAAAGACAEGTPRESTSPNRPRSPLGPADLAAWGERRLRRAGAKPTQGVRIDHRPASTLLEPRASAALTGLAPFLTRALSRAVRLRRMFGPENGPQKLNALSSLSLDDPLVGVSRARDEGERDPCRPPIQCLLELHRLP